MHIRCEQCELDMEVPPGAVGKTLRCPACGGTFTCRLPTAQVVEDEPQELVLSDEVEPVEEVIELAEEVEPESDEDADAMDLTDAAPADAALDVMSRRQPKKIIKENPRQWYVMLGGVAAVALTYEELKAKAAAGKIRPKDKIHYAPRELTLQAREVPGLFPEQDAKRKKQEEEAKKPKFRLRKPDQAKAAQIADLAATLGLTAEAEGGAAEGADDDEPTGAEGAEAAGDTADDAASDSDNPLQQLLQAQSEPQPKKKPATKEDK